jgi:hypothetical protein
MERRESRKYFLERDTTPVRTFRCENNLGSSVQLIRTAENVRLHYIVINPVTSY